MKLTAAVTVIASLFAPVKGVWVVSDDGLFDNFGGTELDSSEWRIGRRNWGGSVDGVEYNGGVLKENVKVQGGNLILEAHGNLYEGELKGINRDFCERPDGKRVGAAIATERYFASGRYEVKMKIAPVLGVATALWTFHYQEIYEGEEGYQYGEVGGPQGYYAVNHEIDMEFPGRPGPAYEGFTFERALTNTWVGENEDEHTVANPVLEKAQNDNEFHIYRFDWHTGSPEEERRVEFYVDNTLVRRLTTHVPTLASRFWLAAWFPRFWAGEPEFDITTAEVDWVRIVPFHEDGDDFDTPEDFADYGWADAGNPGCCDCEDPPQPWAPPPVETFAAGNSQTVNMFGGENGVAIDPEENCGPLTGPPSEGRVLRRSTGGFDNSEYLRFIYTVETNDACGYEYSSAYMTIGDDYRDMSGATGVKFSLRGTAGDFIVLINSKSVSPCLLAEGVDRRNEMKTTVSVDQSWTTYDIKFSEMQDYKNFCPFVENDIGDVGSIAFSVTQVRSGNLRIDNVEFY